MAVDVAAGLGLDAVADVFGGDGPESFSGLSGFEHKGELELAQAATEFVGLVEFLGLALGAARLERVGHAQGGRSDFVGHPAGDQKVASVTLADPHHIGFGTKAWDLGGQDDFGMGHGR